MRTFSDCEMLILNPSKLRAQLEKATGIAVWLAAAVVLLWVVTVHLNEPSPKKGRLFRRSRSSTVTVRQKP